AVSSTTSAATIPASTAAIPAGVVWVDTEYGSILTSFGSQGSSGIYGNNRFYRQSRNPGIVCFICEEKGHIAWDCS
ncbi:10419_t:CDS:2, partial [Gigaspora rosea]